MANYKILLLIFCCLFYLVTSRFIVCPETSDPPETLNFIPLESVDFFWTSLNPVVLSEKLLINTINNYMESTKNYYTDSLYCPQKYSILKKEDYEDIIKSLGQSIFIFNRY